MRTALTIAGSDSSGGAGIQADLQDVRRVRRLRRQRDHRGHRAEHARRRGGRAAVSADLVTAQIEAVAGDIAIDATKIGMLATAAIVEAVAAAIAELELPLVVVDPGAASRRAASGCSTTTACRRCARELLPRARVVTPNIPEAEALSGRRIASLDDAREAARRIHDMGAAAVIITGGHRTEPRPARRSSTCCSTGTTFHEFRAAAHRQRATRTAPAARLRRPSRPASRSATTLPDAAARAQQYVAGAIAHAPGIGHGRGPLDHFWECDGSQSSRVRRFRFEVPGTRILKLMQPLLASGPTRSRSDSVAGIARAARRRGQVDRRRRTARS